MREPEGIAAGALLFGPGERLNDLRLLVQATSPGAAVRQLADLDELGERHGDDGVLLVDADVLPAEDVGYLRRFLTRQSGFQLTLVGEDSSRRVARSLLRLPRVRWLGWPPDVDDLRHLAAPARERTFAAATSPAGPRTSEVRPVAPAHRSAAPGDELARIEAILDLPDVEEPIPGPAPQARTGSAPPAYFRDQVADLADIAQRIEGGLASLREPGSAPGAGVDALSSDVARLVQFTRTLSYLSAAPPRGDQVFDLAELAETLVAGLPKKGPQAPRWMARSSGPLPVSSDRELLLQVFDALLFLAESCSSRGEIVRVQAAEAKSAGPRRASVTIEFPAGPLAELEPAQIVEPYGVRRLLPDLGPNALSAARGIVSGQGGRLDLEKSGRGRFTWVLELPLAAAAAPHAPPSGATERKRPVGEGEASAGHASRGAADPFA